MQFLTVFFVMFLSLFSVPAFAVLTPHAASAVNAVQTDFNSLISLAYPIMIAIVVSLVIFGLVQSFIHKAAGK